jgi:hypothetical protein
MGSPPLHHFYLRDPFLSFFSIPISLLPSPPSPIVTHAATDDAERFPIYN